MGTRQATSPSTFPPPLRAKGRDERGEGIPVWTLSLRERVRVKVLRRRAYKTKKGTLTTFVRIAMMVKTRPSYPE